MAHAFVTGGTGFIGSHLVGALVARGDQVTCLVRSSSQRQRVAQLTRLGAQIVEAEIWDAPQLEPALKRCDVVYHVAGVTRARSRMEFHRVNAQATYELLAPLEQRSTPPIVVLVSSLAAAGPAPRGQVRRECDAPSPVSHYGMSKLVAELLARSLADKLPISIARPPIVLGPGDTTSVELFRMLGRVPLHLTPGFRRTRYSLIFAADLGQGLIATAERGERLPAESAEHFAEWNSELAREGIPPRMRFDDKTWAETSCTKGGQGVYYLASNERITYAELGRLVARAVGRRRIMTWPMPKTLIWCAAGWNEIVARARGRATFFGWDKCREAITGDWTCSPAKAREQLGFQTNDDLAAQIQATFEWYRLHGWL